MALTFKVTERKGINVTYSFLLNNVNLFFFFTLLEKAFYKHIFFIFYFYQVYLKYYECKLAPKCQKG